MKINEITESWYDKLSAIGQTAKGAGAQQKIRQQTDTNIDIAQGAAQGAGPAPSPETSKFLKQFEIIDNDPITVQWKNQQFQRNATTGQWVNFPGGKPVSQQMVNALDRINPPPASAKGGFTYPWQKDIEYQVNPQGTDE